MKILKREIKSTDIKLAGQCHCNYQDNYYGDQVCLQTKGSTKHELDIT